MREIYGIPFSLLLVWGMLIKKGTNNDIRTRLALQWGQPSLALYKKTSRTTLLKDQPFIRQWRETNYLDSSFV